MVIKLGLYSFRFRWTAIFITLIVFIILINLASWQSSRADFKQQRLEQISEYQQFGVMDITQLLQLNDRQDPTGVKVELTGTFSQPHSWLLDNKVVKGKTGYDVLLALRLFGHNKAILINMGWIAADYAYRDQLPAFEIPTGEITVIGIVKAGDLDAFTLSNQSINKQLWPQRIQQIELDKFEKDSGMNLYPFVIYAEQRNDWQFVHHYQPVVMPPEKHRAYALQWYLLALAVILIFIFASRVNTSEANQ